MAKASKTPEEYEELGRAAERLMELGYINKKQMIKASFLKGLIGGLAGVLGATLILALLIWILSLLDEVPLIGRLFENARDTISR